MAKATDSKVPTAQGLKVAPQIRSEAIYAIHQRDSFNLSLVNGQSILTGETELSTVDSSLTRQYLYYQILPHFVEPIHILDQFLDDNTHLFTLVGVFAAFTIYLQTIGERIGNQSFINYGLVVGFLIVVFLSLLVLAKMLPYYYKTSSVIMSTETWGLSIFGFFYIQVISLTVGVIAQFEQVLSAYLVIFSVIAGQLFGFGVSLGYVSIVGKISNYLDRLDYPFLWVAVFVMLYVGGLVGINLSQIPQVDEIDGLVTLSQAYLFGAYTAYIMYVFVTGIVAIVVVAYTPKWVWKQRDILSKLFAGIRRLIPI